MGRAKTKKAFKTYWLLSLIRVLFVFAPQTGYIHPDEYFQTIEVLAGRIFKFEASLPWEFNVTSPIRSVGATYFTVGLSYKVLDIIDLATRAQLNLSVVTPYTLLVTPRLLMCLCSFLVDYSLYKICHLNNEKHRSRFLILATSYVMIVYGTRTFTNTIEMILFAVLLYYISESMIFSNIIVRQREYINKRYTSSKNVAEKAKFHKLRLFLASDSYRNAFQISTITVIGFFNRPTFLCFAVMPIFLWLYRGIGFKSVATLEFHARILVLILCAIPTVILSIVFDSFFYGYISWGEIGMLDVSINSFVFTPLNFIKYNMDNENLAKHGLHPRFLHFLVNVPLLFNVLGLVALWSIVDMVIKLLRRRFHMLPTVRSIKGLMTASFLTPTLLLSIFPHQEPRFLLPIVLPLTYLYSSKIYKEPEYELVKAPKEMFKRELLEKKISKKESQFLLKLWLSANMLCAVYYGLIQQGGVFAATKFLSNEINEKPHFNYHIVTSHIYSMPHVLFMQPDTDTLFYRNNLKYQVSKHVFTYEEGSKNVLTILEKLSSILRIAASKNRRYKFYLVMSGSLEVDLYNTYRTTKYASMYALIYRRRFFPHVSFEAPPDFTDLIKIVSATDVKNLKVTELQNCMYGLVKSLSLVMYEIRPVLIHIHKNSFF